jgi:hypothetical protein
VGHKAVAGKRANAAQVDLRREIGSQEVQRAQQEKLLFTSAFGPAGGMEKSEVRIVIEKLDTKFRELAKSHPNVEVEFSPVYQEDVNRSHQIDIKIRYAGEESKAETIAIKLKQEFRALVFSDLANRRHSTRIAI